MASSFHRLSIRTQIFLLTLAIMLPVAAMLAWLLGTDVRYAREAAHEKVRNLADNAAANIERHLRQNEVILGRFAARPQVKALDPNRCDPIVAEFVRLNPAFINVVIRDRQANPVCTFLPRPPDAAEVARFPWFIEGLHNGRFTAGDAFLGRASGRWVSVLTHPIRNDAGTVTGLLGLPVDLLSLGEDVLGSVPRNAVVRVLDRNFTTLLRSADAGSFVGKPAPAGTREATQGMREGFLTITDLDGVSRLNAFVTIPGVEWRVAAGLPEAEVFAQYRAMLQRSLGIGLAVLLFALALAWRIGASVAKPIADLADTAARATAGDNAARARIAGSVEIESVARQFNRMLDARDESERFLRGFADRMPAMTSYWDKDLICRFANRAYVDWFGLESGGVTGRHLRDVIGETLFATVEPHVRAVLQGTEQRFERTVSMPSGQEGYALVHYVPDIADGQVKGFFSVAFDITEHERAQKSIRELKDRQSAIIDASIDAIISVDEDERIVVFSAAAQKLFHLSAAEAVGQTIDRFIPARFRDSHRGHVRRFMQSGVTARAMGQFTRLTALRPDGTEFPIEASISHVVSDGSHLFTVTIRDITERERAEAALRESEERYRTLIEWSPEPFFVHREGKIIYVNAAAIKMYGARSAQELIGKPVLDTVHPDSRQMVLARWKNMAEHGAGVPMVEQRYLKLDGTAIDVEAQATPIVFDGEPSVHVAIRDITARKQAEAARASLEAQLRESQKMQAIGTLAGGIAHDFNNIIATILGNAELAREDVIGTNPLALQSLEEIRKAGSRGRDLVRQILSFSRRQPVERKRIALAPVVEESVRLLRATLPARVTLEAHCEADVPAVLADATQIEQVLINLATNAMQAMRGEPGRIVIRLDTVMLDVVLASVHPAHPARPALQAMHAKHPDRTVRLALSDTGQGMDAATLSRIFEPFFTTKPVDEGTGLGLSVVHGIVHAHEGAIVVESRLGKGSIFTIYLPGAKVEDAQEDAPAPGKSASASASASVAATADIADIADIADTADTAGPDVRGGQRLLYIDDDDALVFLVKRLLERRGYRVSGYTHQGEGLTALRADPDAFDLVLTDYNMPGMSGLDVAREVRAIRADLPVVVASGFIDETLRAQAGGAGVSELIFKATAVEDFCEVVQRLAQRVGGVSKAS